MRRLAPVFIAILLLGVGATAYTLTRPKAANTPTATESTTPAANEGTTQTPSETTDTAQSVTISYSASGFSPANITVKSGQTVTVVNNSGRSLDFSSDPHPEHTENPELNQETITSGNSQTFTPTRTGTWSYHNHLRAADKGQITVE